MGSKTIACLLYLTICLGSITHTMSRVSMKLENISKNPQVASDSPSSERAREDGTESRQTIPTFLLPTEIMDPSNLNLKPVDMLPLDFKPLQVSQLDSKSEYFQSVSKPSHQLNAQPTVVKIIDEEKDFIDNSKSINTNPGIISVRSEILSENLSKSGQGGGKVKEEEKEEDVNVEKDEDNYSDITLELNPNSSDLEFLHTNSTHKPFNPIPSFTAQILTLSYGGVKNPVLIVQPEMSKNKINFHKNSENSKDPSSSSQSSKPIEETSIPTFTVHFPLETNSQFQIPRYNFTLPTLFLPGLVFTQNENVKTNTHEVHVSFPHTYDLSLPFPPPLGQTEFELLPMNPKDSVGQQTSHHHHDHQKPQNVNVKNETVEQNHKNPPISNHSKISLHRDEDHSEINQNVKTKPKPNSSHKPNHNTTINKPSTVLNTTTTATSPSKNKWKLPSFGQIYSNLFGAGRRECGGESMQNAKEEEEEEDASLCGSDGLCGVTCHRLGFHLGKCTDEISCVCLLKQRPDLGLQLEYYADKRVRSWEEIYPVHGLCHISSCRINCERAGYVTGFCDTTCLCGLPWAEKLRHGAI